MTILRLIRIDFDHLENRDPITRTCVKTLIPSELSSGYAELSDWFSKQPKEKLYVGWDEQIYPQWKIKKERVDAK